MQSYCLQTCLLKKNIYFGFSKCQSVFKVYFTKENLIRLKKTSASIFRFNTIYLYYEFEISFYLFLKKKTEHVLLYELIDQLKI